MPSFYSNGVLHNLITTKVLFTLIHVLEARCLHYILIAHQPQLGLLHFPKHISALVDCLTGPQVNRWGPGYLYYYMIHTVCPASSDRLVGSAPVNHDFRVTISTKCFTLCYWQSDSVNYYRSNITKNHAMRYLQLPPAVQALAYYEFGDDPCSQGESWDG